MQKPRFLLNDLFVALHLGLDLAAHAGRRGLELGLRDPALGLEDAHEAPRDVQAGPGAPRVFPLIFKFKNSRTPSSPSVDSTFAPDRISAILTRPPAPAPSSRAVRLAYFDEA